MKLWHYVHLLIFINILNIIASPTPIIPDWREGDWWRLESKVYHHIRTTPNFKPHWGDKQTWDFRVENLERIGGNTFYILSVKGGNSILSYRFWIRKRDLYISQYEISQDGQPITSKQKMVQRHLKKRDKNNPNAFLEDILPDVPFSLCFYGPKPLKKKAASMLRKAGSRKHKSNVSDLVQQLKSVELGDVFTRLNRDMQREVSSFRMNKGNFRMNKGNRCSIKTNEIREDQYWFKKYPWSLYGERKKGDVIYMKYWLVDFGNSSYGKKP